MERSDNIPINLKEVFTSGEQLKITPALKKLFRALPHVRFCNQYGPTEGHVVSEYELSGSVDKWSALPPIGKAIDQVDLKVLDPDMNEVPRGKAGELFLLGACLADGYINDQARTAERFIETPFGRAYSTGDLVEEDANGDLIYKGRIDGQVKVRGYRIELGEVENAMSGHPLIEQAVATVREDAPGAKRLVAYYTSTEDKLDISSLRTHLSVSLPDYMLPSAYVYLPKIPLTPSGKIDRKNLPDPSSERPELNTPFVAPATNTQKQIAQVWIGTLGIEKIGIDDNFFELGGNSLLSIQTIAELEHQHGVTVPVVKLYQTPTIRGIAEFLEGAHAHDPQAAAQARMAKRNGAASTDAVAIVGMSGRFPGAENIQELWQMLLDGRDGITRFKDDEIDATVSDDVKNHPDHVAARGVMKDADKFDSDFFQVNPRVADLMDPQQRVFLETAWAALEDAGCDPNRYDGSIGVFAGIGNNTYYTKNVLTRPELVAQVGDFQTMVGNEKDYIATRLAFEFDLSGPAISIHTACSTSLTAIAQAYKAITHGDCDMAIAGGIAITVPINSGVIYNEGGMYSPDGLTRPFDKNAKGTSFSDGVGIVILKRRSSALADGDNIHALIKGVAVNNDGRNKASFTAPSVQGQADVIAIAQADAGIDPTSISYIETHGTATPLGDPIEVEGLNLAFGGGTEKYCTIGSIKSNIGHLTAAAGVAGLIKTALSLREEVLPGTLNFSSPNPTLDLNATPFRITSEKQDWKRSDTPRRAGISSFGVGGTNAHVILEEAPLPIPSDPGREQQVLFLSAKTKEALDRRTEQLLHFLRSNPDVDLADLAYTLDIGRRPFHFRRIVSCDSVAHAIKVIESKDASRISSKEFVQQAPGILFLFPGQGSQYVGMGKDLYAKEPVFAKAFDACCDQFKTILKEDIKPIIFAEGINEEEASAQLKQTRYTQPTLFTVQYALAQLWLSWGVKPVGVIGHSIGEFAAACLAGIFSLEDAIKLVAARGSMMQELPEGSMLSVRASEELVQVQLPKGCSIAANNGPELCVASGPEKAIAALEKELEAKDIMCKLLHTSHAFHSPMMDPMVGPYEKLASTVSFNAPRIPMVSTVTADWIKESECTDPAYWSGHVRATVRFAQAVKKGWESGDHVMLEVGPRNTASTLARQQSADMKTQVAIASLGKESGNGKEFGELLRAVGQLWQQGITLDNDRYFEGRRRNKLQLPTYPFERKRHWVTPGHVHTTSSDAPLENDSKPSPSIHANSDASPKDQLITELKEILESSSGIELEGVSNDTTFLDMGLDSLFLTQVALTLQKKFKTRITFRQLNEDLCDLDRLADFLEDQVDLGTNDPVQENKPTARTSENEPASKKEFGAIARIQREATDELTPPQRKFIEHFKVRYNKRTAKSKAHVEANRSHMADPRVVTGFKPLIKELVYPIVVERSRGCHLWDLDGNEYIDILNGFGSSLFGYMPDFIREACHQQLDKSIDIGPQTPLAGEVTKLMCELTGHDRSAVCNTGSEAVLGAMRIARTVTGKSLIIAFNGAYHGINDEVIVRGSKSLKSFPAAPGIMPEAVQNMLILDYGTSEALEIIKERIHEVAAVLVEPVQSRRPEFRPVDFLREVRALTKENNCALIFDEVITGYRMHQGGAQALFGIKADIGTYGKVFGGGMPIGGISGTREYMDALDGGHWQFGDDSIPEVGVTYFAGTFVRHPLTMAAAKASLEHMKRSGPALQERLNDLTDRLANEANRIFTAEKAPYWMVNFGSLFKIKYDDSVPYIELFFTLMRDKGVHIWDGFPCFLTEAHTEMDLSKVINAITESIHELKDAKLLPEKSFVLEKVNNTLNGHTTKPEERIILASEPLVRGAKLGMTESGDAAWFIPDPEKEGKFLQLIET